MFGFDFGESGNSGGLLARGKALLSLILQVISSRIELIATEVEEEYERLWPLLVLTLVALVLLSFALFFLSLFIIVYFWDTEHRLAAVGVVGAVYLFAGTLLAVHVNGLWSRRSRLFETTLAELKKDLQRLQD